MWRREKGWLSFRPGPVKRLYEFRCYSSETARSGQRTSRYLRLQSGPCDYWVSKLTGLCHVAGGSPRGRRCAIETGIRFRSTSNFLPRRLQPQFAVRPIILSGLKPLQHRRPCFSSHRSFLVQGRNPSVSRGQRLCRRLPRSLLKSARVQPAWQQYRKCLTLLQAFTDFSLPRLLKSGPSKPFVL